MTELVSVIVPIYNVEKYLERCIKSIINQTYQNIEILLVNDGSPDNSKAIMEKYAKKDKRIVCCYKENGGLSDARNYGIKKSKGKYVCFIDSDDYIEKNYVEKLYNCMIENKAEITWCDIKQVNDEGKVGSMNQSPDDVWSFEMASACNRLFLKSLFIKNDIWFPVGIWYEDLATTPRLFLSAKKTAYVNEELYNYYVTPGSITRTYDKRVLDAKKVLQINLEYCKEKHLLESKEIYEIVEYMFLYSELNTAFRVSMAHDLKVKDIKEFTYWCESIFKDIYNNRIAKTRLDRVRKILAFLLKHRMFYLTKFVIRVVKRVKG